MQSFITAPNPTSENIFFDVFLEATYWDKPPELKILVDGNTIGHYIIDRSDLHIRFRRVMSFDQLHVLELHRLGKTVDQTKIHPDGSIETQMLKIKTIKLDNIDLKNIILHTSEFEPIYPEPWASQQKALGIELEKKVPGEMYFGHNGVWKFEFTSPIYKFLVNWVRG